MFGLGQKLFGSNTDFRKLVNEGALILDVRTPAEFSAGNIKSSKNVPLDQLKSKLSELKEENKPIITVCRSGARSRMAHTILSEAGLTAYNGGPWSNLEQNIK